MYTSLLSLLFVDLWWDIHRSGDAEKTRPASTHTRHPTRIFFPGNRVNIKKNCPSADGKKDCIYLFVSVLYEQGSRFLAIFLQVHGFVEVLATNLFPLLYFVFYYPLEIRAFNTSPPQRHRVSCIPRKMSLAAWALLVRKSSESKISPFSVRSSSSWMLRLIESLFVHKLSCPGLSLKHCRSSHCANYPAVEINTGK